VAGGVAPEAAESGDEHQSVHPVALAHPTPPHAFLAGERRPLARIKTAVEGGTPRAGLLDELRRVATRTLVPALGVTGSGGSGKSSPADEMVRRSASIPRMGSAPPSWQTTPLAGGRVGRCWVTTAV